MSHPQYLLGLKVIRSGLLAETSHVVWSGYTEADRQDHAEFIRTKCHDPEHDGVLTLEPVQAPVVITEPGLYVGPGCPKGVRVSRIDAKGNCLAFLQKLDRWGRLKDGMALAYLGAHGFGRRWAWSGSASVKTDVLVTEKITAEELQDCLRRLKEGEPVT